MVKLVGAKVKLELELELEQLGEVLVALRWAHDKAVDEDEGPVVVDTLDRLRQDFGGVAFEVQRAVMDQQKRTP